MGCCPTAVCDQAGEQHEDELPGWIHRCIRFLYPLLRLLILFQKSKRKMTNMARLFLVTGGAESSNPLNNTKQWSQFQQENSLLLFLNGREIGHIFPGTSPTSQSCCSSNKSMLPNECAVERITLNKCNDLLMACLWGEVAIHWEFISTKSAV